MSPNEPLAMETWYGIIKTPEDAIKLFEACRLGLLPRVQRRLSEKERQQIRPGSVFVWDERESGMRRWTDGKSWSASRVAGSFLQYKEMDGRRGLSFGTDYGVFGSRSSNGRPRRSTTGSDNSTDEQQQQQQQQQRLDEKTQQLSDVNTAYRHKDNGLLKQSFSITTTDHECNLHLISYWSTTAAAHLRTPSSDPSLAALRPPRGLYPETSHGESPRGPNLVPAAPSWSGSRRPQRGYPLHHLHTTVFSDRPYSNSDRYLPSSASRRYQGHGDHWSLMNLAGSSPMSSHRGPHHGHAVPSERTQQQRYMRGYDDCTNYHGAYESQPSSSSYAGLSSESLALPPLQHRRPSSPDHGACSTPGAISGVVQEQIRDQSRQRQQQYQQQHQQQVHQQYELERQRQLEPRRPSLSLSCLSSDRVSSTSPSPTSTRPIVSINLETHSDQPRCHSGPYLPPIVTIGHTSPASLSAIFSSAINSAATDCTRFSHDGLVGTRMQSISPPSSATSEGCLPSVGSYALSRSRSDSATAGCGAGCGGSFFSTLLHPADTAELARGGRDAVAPEARDGATSAARRALDALNRNLDLLR